MDLLEEKIENIGFVIYITETPHLEPSLEREGCFNNM